MFSLQFASQSDIGKAKVEPENKKTAFKSATFHLILPFMAYFKGICLTTIDCREHSLLKMVGYLWGEWDPERPITQTELSSKFRFRSCAFWPSSTWEHSLLKMVGYLWGEWDQERPITQTELSSDERCSLRITWSS
ncbi:unnamed protein product [Ectocarpus sp. CCAP 1310/34]|nr:unnamed protein product [Ectocarpus sp. CCAP 1310/34]